MIFNSRISQNAIPPKEKEKLILLSVNFGQQPHMCQNNQANPLVIARVIFLMDFDFDSETILMKTPINTKKHKRNKLISCFL